MLRVFLIRVISALAGSPLSTNLRFFSFSKIKLQQWILFLVWALLTLRSSSSVSTETFIQFLFILDSTEYACCLSTISKLSQFDYFYVEGGDFFLYSFWFRFLTGTEKILNIVLFCLNNFAALNITVVFLTTFSWIWLTSYRLAWEFHQLNFPQQIWREGDQWENIETKTNNSLSGLLQSSRWVTEGCFVQGLIFNLDKS